MKRSPPGIQAQTILPAPSLPRVARRPGREGRVRCSRKPRLMTEAPGPALLHVSNSNYVQVATWQSRRYAAGPPYAWPARYEQPALMIAARLASGEAVEEEERLPVSPIPRMEAD